MDLTLPFSSQNTISEAPGLQKLLPQKRLSIFLPKSNRRTSVMTEEEKSQLVPGFRGRGPKHLTMMPAARNQGAKKRDSRERYEQFPMSPFLHSLTNIMQDSRRHSNNDELDEEHLEGGEIGFRFRDSEERNMLYQQICRVIANDDNQDFSKRRILLEEDPELDAFWEVVDPAEEFQKEADQISKLQETQQFLYCERKNPFELIKMYADPYPLLDLRKAFAYYSRKVSVFCETIIKKPWFDNLVLGIILWNCVLLAIEEPGKPTTAEETLMEQVLLACYTVEMLLKILGMGFVCPKGAYLQDGWNVLDFIIIVTSYLPYIFTNEGDTSSTFKFSSLRTLRVLRPLRTISSIKSLRDLLTTLFSSMPLLLDILLFLLFFFLSFAMLGTHLFAGSLKQRCFAKETGIIESTSEVCGYQQCSEESFCGKGLDNPYYGVMNFDNILFSLVMGFQCVTLQAWTVIMVEVIRGYSVYVIVYFVSLVFFGSFFLLNLTLAVIKSKFTDTQKLKESLGKEALKKISEVQINELKLLKRLERSHFKRLKNQPDDTGIGASEEGRPGNSRFNEITWDDLLQLKEMIHEERLREEENERFENLRQERIKSDDLGEEGRLTLYIRQVEELKKSAFRVFLKNPKIRERFDIELKKSVKRAEIEKKKAAEPKIVIDSTGELPRTESSRPRSHTSNKIHPLPTENNDLIGTRNRSSTAKVFPLKDIGKSQSFKAEALKMDSFTESPKAGPSEMFLIPPPNGTVSHRPSRAPSGRSLHSQHKSEATADKTAEKPQEEKSAKFRKSMTLNTKKKESMRPSKLKIPSPREREEEKDSQSVRSSMLRPPSEEKSESSRKRSGSFKISRVSQVMKGRDDIEGNAEKMKSPKVLKEPRDDIEDPLEFLKAPTPPKPRVLNALQVSFSDLRANKPKKAQAPALFVRRQSMRTLKSIPSFSITLEDSQRLEAMVSAIEEEQSDQEDRESKNNRGNELFTDRTGNTEAINPAADVNPNLKVRGSYEPDLLNDSDFNDSVTLQAAKLESMLQEKRREEPANSDETEGVETKLSDRPLLTQTNTNTDTPQSHPALIHKATTNEEKPVNALGLKPQLSSGLKRGNTFKPSKKYAKFKKVQNLSPASKDKADGETLRNKPNIRDFKLMIDTAKVYNCFSKEDVLEHRIRLCELQRKKELQLIASQTLPIELKPCSFGNFSKEVLDQIKENRKKSKTIRNIARKRRLRIALRTNWVFKEGQLRPPAITLRRQFIPNLGSFSKTSIAKSPRKGAFKVKKKVALKLDEELEMNYEVIAQKIAECMIPKGPAAVPDADEEDYTEIHRQDKASKCKCERVWSGSDVLPLKIFHGEWTEEEINRFFAALSLSKQDRLIWLRTFSGKLLILHKHAKRFLTGPFFEKTLLLIVVFNTIILCFDGLFNDEDTTRTISRLYYFFNILFVIEFGVKFLVFGPRNYIRDIMNLFDGVVATMSLLELTTTGTSNLSFIKVFRVLRVARLLRSIAFMRMIVNIIKRALKSFIYIALLLLLFLFIYSLLGMQLFGGAFHSRSQELNIEYRENFDSFSNAFITAFQILTSTAWQHLLYLAYGSAANIYLTVLYIVSWIFIGNYVLLNLFLAIILDEFTKDENYQLQSEETFDYSQEFLFKETIQTAATSQTQIQINSSMEPNEELSEKASEGKKLFQNIECHYSLFLFNKRNKLRILCYRASNNPKVEDFWLFVIVANAVKMILDTYFQDDPVLSVLDTVFFALFTLELLVKVVAMGFVLDRGSYLRDYWNVLDLIIVIFALIDLSVENLNFSVIKGFRVLRMLRPLRLISHNVNMKIVVTALLNSITSIVNIIFVILLIWLMFAILGISLYKDKMGHCEMAEGDSYYSIGYDECLAEGYQWTISDTNFDNIYNAMITLFVISSRELWADIMYLCMDAGEKNSGPEKDQNPVTQYYFVAFILIGSYFLLNLLVGVIFFNFNKAKRNEQHKSLLFLTEEQAKWLNIQKMIAQVKPDFLSIRKPKNQFRLQAFKIVTHRYYENCITLLISINIIILAIYFDQAPKAYISALNGIVIAFQIFYIIEVCGKLVGLGAKAYWYDTWNRLDFILTCFSIIDVFFWSIGISIFIFVFEITRILRILRLLKFFKGLQKLLETLLFSLPPLINVGALLMLIIFVYAILGVNLFSNIKHGEIIDDYNNFKNFGFAMLILFKVMSGDEWFHVMFDLYHKPEGCQDSNSCGSVASIFYFISYFLICAYIMLNLFILIIIQQFEDFHLKEDNPITNFKRNLESFSRIWAEFSEASFGLTINSKKLIDFYMKLDPPLGFDNLERPKVALEIMKMNLAGDEEGNIYFNELLFASMKRVFGQEILNNVSKEIKEMMENQEKQIKARLERRTLKMINSFYGESPLTRPRSKSASVNNSPIKSPNKKQIVNPMITILFVGMVFKSWKRWTEHWAREELYSNGSVIRPPKSESDEEDSDSEESDSASEDSSRNNEGFGETLSPMEENESMTPIAENEEEGGSEKKSESEDEESGGDRKDKQKIAFNAIGKFISKKRMAESDERLESEAGQREEGTRGMKRRSNMFRTFFALSENKVKLQKA